MRMPRIRFTVRRMMIAVAIAAALIWSGVSALRWADYRAHATHHEQVAVVLSYEIDAIRENGGAEAEATMREGVKAQQARQAARYRRAMRRLWMPWLPVEPDPPAPE